MSTTSNSELPTPTETVEPVQEIRHRLALAFGAALLVAGLLLVTVILPAEYAVDPLGRGQPLLVVVANDACGLIDHACVSAEGIQPLDLGDQRIETDALQPCAERSPASFDPAAAANIHQEEGRFSP